ncbi:MAG: tryptophan--tRNA ligase [Vallitaleaceae bacterium]|jgi:tryptophanyl-tRNA synthetase|nr:tryptophan--tRNA ligase [Vallitaleaceae bacterium]
MGEDKKVIFSGIQPSGAITIGNYFGALKNWTKLQDEYNCLFCVVDMHAITVRQNPAELRQQARDLLALYIAVGLDPKKNIMYYQSHVPQHAELAWILNCFTYMGELSRMTQFKEKSSKQGQNINAGLFTYPVLMAADILLYQTDLVPVGHDQKQHLELTRDIATRFNQTYGDVFKVPDPFIAKVGARIMSLQEPTSKMSKSDENPNNFISLLDDLNVIKNRIKRAVTDSEKEIIYTADKPGVKNLLDIYSCSTNKAIAEIMPGFEGKGYGDLKKAVADALIAEIEPIQKRFQDIRKDKAYLDDIIKTNTDTAKYLADKTLRKVKKKIGFPQ